MGYPHPTIEVPGNHPAVEREVSRVLIKSTDSESLLKGLRGGDAPAGHVCATAWVFDQSLSQILLLEHSELGWSNPGGHVEVDETSRDAAARELFEETGIVATPAHDAPIVVHPSTSNKKQSHVHWNIGWVFIVPPDSPLISEDGKKLLWFRVGDLPQGAADLSPTLAKIQAHLNAS